MKTLAIVNDRQVTCPNHIHPTRRMKETKAVVRVVCSGQELSYGLRSEVDALEFVSHQLTSGNEAYVAKIF
jgi:hypothetical protein